MSLTQKVLEFDFALAQGVFAGGGNTHTVRGLRSHAQIVKAGGATFGGAQIEVYGLTLDIMNKLSTYGQVLTVTSKNTLTIKAGEVGGQMTTVFTGNIASASMDGQAQPNVPFRVEAYAGAYENAKPVTPTSQAGSTDVATLLQTAAQKAGLQFENNGVSVKVQNPYLPGTAVQQIRALAEHARVEHIIDNGMLAIWPAGQARQGASTVISPQTGLVGYPQFDSQGVIFRTLFRPSLAYGQAVNLQSQMQPACGTWNIYKLNYDLAALTPNGPWFQDVWAYRPGTAPTPPVG